MGDAAVGNDALRRGETPGEEVPESESSAELSALTPQVEAVETARSGQTTWRSPGGVAASDKQELRVAFVGPRVLLDAFAPAPAHPLVPERFVSGAGADPEAALAAAEGFGADVTVVLDPTEFAAASLAGVNGLTLGLLPEGVPSGAGTRAAAALDRIVSFTPALTGTRIGRSRVWRAIPQPVSDALYGEPRRLHHGLRAMAVGRSTPHREEMLAPVKHHHDLLHVIHGVSGELLSEFLREYDVGVYVGREQGGAYGWQVGMHLAAGHLLLAESLVPTHGLERGIDYLEIDSPGGIVFLLERIARFPEMYHSVRVRGRLKAEQFRASRLFARLVHDLLADVAAFGSARRTR
jgi:hypothetical protein